MRKMTELMEKAVNKIDGEAEKGGANLKRIAQYVIDKLIYDDNSANKVLDEKKTLSDCWKNLMSRARPLAENGCAFVEPQTVYEWVSEYFGVAEKQQSEGLLRFDLADLL